MSEPSPASGIVVLPHTGRASAADPRQLRSMPVAESILWSPTVGGAHRPAPLMFFAQQTLRKIHDRLNSLPNGLATGLLTGRRYADGRGAQFIVIDGALPLPALPAEDETIEALAQGMRTAAPGIEIFGWYRGHSFSDAALTPGDVEAQSELFADRPCIVLVVAAGGEAGAVFRSSTNPAWPVEALPFYEWITDRAVTEGANGGAKPTSLAWRNYRTSEAVVRVVGPAAGSQQPIEHIGHPVLMPDAGDDDDELPLGVRPGYRRFVRPATYAAAALGGAILVAVAAFLWNARGAGTGARGGSGSGDPRGGAAADPIAQAAAIAVLDRRADTLTLALTAFDDRSRMFEARQMPCSGYSRGLQQVEDGWLAYNIARKETLAPDPTRDARDRSLYASVRTAERNFERSGCPRP